MSATAVYASVQIREAERCAVSDHGITESRLMERAGKAAFHLIETRFPSVRSIAVYCGAGNNAGDGYVLARLLHTHGRDVCVYCLKPVQDLPDTARVAAESAIAAGVALHEPETGAPFTPDLIVDALLGTGLKGAPEARFARAIAHINTARVPVLALDVPSGLETDTGKVWGNAVDAAMTLTFIAPKIGLYTCDGRDCSGEIIIDDLGIPDCVDPAKKAATLLDAAMFYPLLAPRKHHSHKGTWGHVLCVGGGPGMPGSIRLTAHAAMRAGCGVVSVATLPAHVSTWGALPEVMVHGVPSARALAPLLARADVCVIGPGLGADAWGSALYEAVSDSGLPMVVDAGALDFLAKTPGRDDNRILTPHPGEAARMLGVDTMDIENDRMAAVSALQSRFGGAVILKGTGTLVRTPEGETLICPAGNPGMATAGMGDVLGGVLGGLLAQGFTIGEAACCGVFLHAQAGDEAALAGGERGMMASDVIAFLRAGVNPV